MQLSYRVTLWIVCGGLLAITLVSAPTLIAQQSNNEDVDHAGIIQSWTDAKRERGRKISDLHCYGCLGYYLSLIKIS